LADGHMCAGSVNGPKFECQALRVRWHDGVPEDAASGAGAQFQRGMWRFPADSRFEQENLARPEERSSQGRYLL